MATGGTVPGTLPPRTTRDIGVVPQVEERGKEMAHDWKPPRDQGHVFAL